VRSEEEIRNKIKAIQNMEISTRTRDSFISYAVSLLEWCLE